MPRNKMLMKKRATTSGPKKRVVIKPFQKPPTLPPNYYETTSRELLDGTLNIIFEKENTSLSLQNSYQQVVNLVSHQYGPRLYQDLIATLQKACQEYVLPENGITSGGKNNSSSAVLGYIQTQYLKYVDYLLLCKHVFLPLDRSHAIVAGTTEVVKRSASGAVVVASSENTPNANKDGVPPSKPSAAASNPNNIQGLWQVGLEQFRKRLQHFQWDDLIYQKWWESLQMDWDGNLALDQQSLLQSTLYMWQDLGVVAATLSQRLEPDLIGLFQSKSTQLKQDSSSMSSTPAGDGDTMMTGDGKYNANVVISYCFDKWMHVAYHWSRFLPKSTCVFLLENYLFKPHLTKEWLLNPQNFDPILEEAFASAKTATPSAALAAAANANSAASSSNTTTSSSPIQQLWMLAGRLPGGNKMVGSAIAQHARTRGVALMSAMNSPDIAKNSSKAAMAGKQKIADLLDLQRQVRQLLSQLPRASDYCKLKDVWEDVVNPSNDLDETNLVAEALAKYVDSCLKDSKKQVFNSSPLDNTGNWAEAVISGVFCYLQAKDVFEAFYKQDLAKRLLWNKIVSMDVERHFVSLLKAECGAGYTSKMEGMFQDMDWSRETMSRYKQTQFQEESSGSNTYKLETDIQVLTTGYWPVYPQYEKLILPESLLDAQNRFNEYYKSKYQGRRMTWQYALGHVVVRFKPEKSNKKYELVVSLCQALALMQFNEGQDLTLPQLMASIGLEDRGEMERILLSLSLGKEGTRVLLKRDHDASETKKKPRMNVHDDDKFRVQPKFESNQRRIRIQNILMKESKEEREKTVEAVSRDRLYVIDAVLVRIMKARKTVTHTQLIPQVLEQIRVPAQPSDIKKRIETLIEREYMERDSADRTRYNYLA